MGINKNIGDPAGDPVKNPSRGRLVNKKVRQQPSMNYLPQTNASRTKQAAKTSHASFPPSALGRENSGGGVSANGSSCLVSCCSAGESSWSSSIASVLAC